MACALGLRLTGTAIIFLYYLHSCVYITLTYIPQPVCWPSEDRVLFASWLAEGSPATSSKPSKDVAKCVCLSSFRRSEFSMCAFYVKRKTTGSRRKARGYIRLCCTGGGNAHLDGCLSKWAHMAESICFRLLFFIYAAVHFSTPNCKANSVCPDCIGNA